MTDKKADPLLPCPFCGPGQSMVDPWFDDVSKRWAIGCGRCGSSSGRSVHAEGSKDAAIKLWNTRGILASQPSAGGLREALETIADHPETFDNGRTSYSVGWAFWNVQQIAKAALAKADTEAELAGNLQDELDELRCVVAGGNRAAIELCARVADRAAKRCVREQTTGDDTARFIAAAIRGLVYAGKVGE